MKYSSFFIFRFHEGIEKRITYTYQDYFYDYYHNYILQVIQEQVRVKSPEVFRCAMITRTIRIRCLENSYF